MAGDDMNALIAANRATAIVSLELAIAMDELANRFARTEQEHEYDAYRLALLKAQRSTPPSTPSPAGRGAALTDEVAAGGVF